MKKLSLTLFFVLLGTSACGDEYPEEPTWEGEIREMLAANCVRCHGDVRASGSHTFRLDVYEDVLAKLESIRIRAVDYEEEEVGQMPPNSYLTNDQKAALGRWIEDGAPRGEVIDD